MADINNNLRRAFRGASGTTDIAAGDTATVTLTAAKSADHRIYVEELTVTIKTDAAQTLSFQDSNGTPVVVEKTDSSPGANTQYVWRFPGGGRPLTKGKNFTCVISGAGLAASIQWVGHQRVE